MEIDFEYRALDLLADYEPQFSHFPGIWKKTIKVSRDERVGISFNNLVYTMVCEAIEALGDGMTDEEFDAKLGHVGDRDQVAIKMMRDLGVNTMIATSVVTYFSARRNLLEDERAWVRFCNLLEEQISLMAC